MVFMGIMKYFRHILMHHKTFFEIFDGPQNIFLCSIFVFLFFKLRVLWSTKYPNYPSRGFKKDKTCLINYIHSADITQIVLKIKKRFDAF